MQDWTAEGKGRLELGMLTLATHWEERQSRRCLPLCRQRLIALQRWSQCHMLLVEQMREGEGGAPRKRRRDEATRGVKSRENATDIQVSATEAEGVVA